MGAVATGQKARGLTSSESCIPKAAGIVCMENPSFVLLLQASCKEPPPSPPDLTSFDIKTSGQLHFLSHAAAWEAPWQENIDCASQTFAGVQEATRAPQRLFCTNTSTNEGSGTALSKLTAKSLPLQFKSHCSQ